MTEKIKLMLESLKTKEYRKARNHITPITSDSYFELDTQLKVFRSIAELENPILFDNDSFGFNRSTDFKVPELYGNVTPNYKRVIENGFDKIISDVKTAIKNTDDNKKIRFGTAILEFLDICFEICNRYKDYAHKCGNSKLSSALEKIPHKGADTLYEALLFMKICIYTLRLYGAPHLTFGRFDQYMYPFFLKDKALGKSNEELLELIEEFFISINYDSDLYFGIQQGDSGQSMVLGGFDSNGNSMYNELSHLCMQSCLELSIIDPKINLRVGKNTPDEIYEYATLLSKQGLGFPQYCNDEVVVPGLVKLGYDLEDALNYSVAACWEYIIPGVASDIPNIATMDFPKVINDTIQKELINCNSFDDLLNKVRSYISRECDRLVDEYNNFTFPDEPFLSVFMDGCIENLTDMWEHGTKYLNFGCHGAGISNATDALSAVKYCIFDNSLFEKEVLLNALDKNFDGYTEIYNLLKSSPKMGNNDDYADEIASLLMNAFSESINNRDNGNGGIWRAGTGSAMEYILKGEKCPATADGRRNGDPYSSSFSPSLDVKPSGLLSVIQSFTKHDMTNIINGGPLTIEIHDNLFRNEIGVKKVAMLVKNFILLGGHQLQLNAISRERLVDAQMYPENYPNLIVRVWGWSGYFNELDVKYQDHIIRRYEFLN